MTFCVVFARGQQLDEPGFPANGRILRVERTCRFPAGPVSVRREQTHKPAARTKKACKCRPSWKRLKGFEPSTFCMASRGRDSAQRGISLQIGLFCRPSGCANARHSPRNHRSFRTETGLALIPPAAGARDLSR